MADLEKLANILGAETIKRIYEDGLSGTVQEIGKMLTDLAKTLRLVTLPFQVGADIQERVTKRLMKVRDSVPEENQIPAPASLTVPIIERIKYLEDENYLIDLYLNLLARAIDKDRVNEAHPAFFHIIEQLSPDEAYFLFRLREKGLSFSSHEDFDYQKRIFSNYKRTKEELVSTEFVFPEHFRMYFAHLESLNLVTWPVINEEYPTNENGVQIGLIKHSILQLTEFGTLFVKACIPEDGFILIKPEKK
jgi:hypothetical protein